MNCVSASGPPPPTPPLLPGETTPRLYTAQVLTTDRYGTGAGGLWRYVTRAAVVARLDKLSTTLRNEDARTEDAAAAIAAEAETRKNQHHRHHHHPQAAGSPAAITHTGFWTWVHGTRFWWVVVARCQIHCCSIVSVRGSRVPYRDVPCRAVPCRTVPCRTAP